MAPARDGPAQEEAEPVIKIWAKPLEGEGASYFRFPGQTLCFDVSVNQKVQSASTNYLTDEKVTGISTEKGLIEITHPLDGYVRFTVKDKENRVGAEIRDTLVVALSDGKTYRFPILATTNDAIDLDLQDERGNSLFRGMDAVRADILNHAAFDTPYNLTVEVLDATEPDEAPPYEVTVRPACCPDSGVRISDPVQKGKRFTFQVVFPRQEKYGFCPTVAIDVKKPSAGSVHEQYHFELRTAAAV